MSMNNSYNYNYRTEGFTSNAVNPNEERRATYTSPQYEDVVKKYLNYDPSQERSTLAVNQGIGQSSSNTFTRSVQYQPATTTSYQTSSNITPQQQYGYNTVSYTTTNNVYGDRLSNIQNVQVKDVQSPEKINYNYYESQDDYDRVKKSKKTQQQEYVITKTTTQYEGNVGVQDYQPMLIGQEKTYNTYSSSSNINRPNSQVIILDNPDTAMQLRSSVNTRIQYQNQTESKSIQDQDITLCNIF